MCGRVILPGKEEIIEKTGLKPVDDIDRPGQVNVPPGGGMIPIFTDSKPDLLQYFAWPLVPAFSKENKAGFSTSNATIENLKSSGLWKRLIGKRHCVIITKGFYEWQYDDPVKKKGSHPHVIRSMFSELTYMAGLWDVWTDRSTGEMFPSCTIITQPANQFMSAIHNTKARMPAFLTEKTAKVWADNELPLYDRMEVLAPVTEDFLYAKEVENVADEVEVMGALVC